MKNLCIRILALGLLAAFIASCNTGSSNGSDDDIVELNDSNVTETLAERYVEKYDASTGDTLETWTYDEDGKLSAYAVYSYNAGGYLTGIRTYSDEGKTLDSTIDYTYDASNNRIAGVMKDAAGTTVSNFDAVYDANHHYTEYKSWEGSVCIEHRTCTYNANGDYVVETFYADETTASVIERFECVYATDITWRWLMEYHSYTDGDLVRNMIHTYTWSTNDMYLQSDFIDAAGNRVLDASDEMSSSILYSFVDVNTNRLMKTRSCMNDKGKQMVYWVYDYDSDGNRIDAEYYYLNESGALELDTQENMNYYVINGESMYELKTYSYAYADDGDESRGALGQKDMRTENRLWSPAPAHYRAE